MSTTAATLTAKRCRQLATAAAICVILLVVWHSRDSWHPIQSIDWHIGNSDGHLQCWSLPGANDTLVIMRTGSTEMKDRLPIHFSTTLKCYPHYMIFSDYEEDYRGEHIIDALESTSPDILANHKDFELYRRLKQNGRQALSEEELSGHKIEPVLASGKPENPGWKLDKWKFVPMANRTYHEYPDMKWYVFVEADTYVLWASLLRYLAALDPTKPHYTGSQVFDGVANFAHGGSAFIVSQPSMRQLAEYYSKHKIDIEALTDAHFAGDAVLGRTFSDSGTPFTGSWPIMQGEDPGMVPYDKADGERVWCYPAVSYHHLVPEAIEDIWHFEQQWIAISQQITANSFLRHKDVFKQYIEPKISTVQEDWNNDADTDEGHLVGGLESCKAKCEGNSECVQYSLDHSTGHCKTSRTLRLGNPEKNSTSAWVVDRVLHFQRNMAPCGNEGWIL